MIDPIFWLGLSILLVAVSLTALLVVAIPAFQELGRAARSAEKLFDTLQRELPPTLEALRLTGLEITDLKDEMSEGVQSAGQVVKQVDQSITGVKQQVQKAQTTTRSVLVGFQAAWQTLTKPSSNKPRRGDQLSSASRNSVPYVEQREQREQLRSSQLERYQEEMIQDDFYPEEDLYSEEELENGSVQLESDAELHRDQHRDDSVPLIDQERASRNGDALQRESHKRRQPVRQDKNH